MRTLSQAQDNAQNNAKTNSNNKFEHNLEPNISGEITGFQQGDKVNCVYQLSKNIYKDYINLQLMILDMKLMD